MQSFTRSLELDPGRLYSLLQSAALHHQLGALTQAAAAYERAMRLSPGHPAALLGAAEARLASAQVGRGDGGGHSGASVRASAKQDQPL